MFLLVLRGDFSFQEPKYLEVRGVKLICLHGAEPDSQVSHVLDDPQVAVG